VSELKQFQNSILKRKLWQRQKLFYTVQKWVVRKEASR